MKIWNFSAALAALLAAASCNGLVDDTDDTGHVASGDITLVSSASVIQANGEDEARFEVFYKGEPVTEGVTIYDGNNNVVDLPSMTFTTTQSGSYSFWAAYGTAFSETVTVTAIDFPVPVLPDDPAPDNQSFARRVLLTQFTGTGCGYCPGMITVLRTVLAEEEYSSKVILAAAHTYNSDDPAYLSSAQLNYAMGISNYPSVVADMNLLYTNYNSQLGLKNTIDDSYERTEALAGISASASVEDGTLVVLTSVKAAATAEFRIGAWLLEDGIYGRQSNQNSASWTGDYNTHDNCIRLADSKMSNSNYTGHPLGTIEAGETAEYAFVMTLDQSWVVDNLHLVIFVTTPEGKAWLVNNAVACPVDGTVEYQYE